MLAVKNLLANQVILQEVNKGSHMAPGNGYCGMLNDGVGTFGRLKSSESERDVPGP